MLTRRIASRYAEALFELAQQQGKTESWERELASLAAVMQASPDLVNVLTHPEVPLPRKEQLLKAAFAGKIAQEILTLLLLLIRRGHEPDIDTIHQIFLERWNRARRVVQATVTSAMPLSTDQTEALAQAIARRTGATVQLSREVDPALIAGLVVRIGDRVIDASARTALEDLRESIHGM